MLSKQCCHHCGLATSALQDAKLGLKGIVLQSMLTQLCTKIICKASNAFQVIKDNGNVQIWMENKFIGVG